MMPGDTNDLELFLNASAQLERLSTMNDLTPILPVTNARAVETFCKGVDMNTRRETQPALQDLSDGLSKTFIKTEEGTAMGGGLRMTLPNGDHFQVVVTSNIQGRVSFSLNFAATDHKTFAAMVDMAASGFLQVDEQSMCEAWHERADFIIQPNLPNPHEVN